MLKQVGVIGAGQMGAGIAQVLAASGVEALLYDQEPEAVDKAISRIAKLLARQLEKGKATELEVAACKSRIKPIRSLSDLQDSPLIIEAIIELESAKLDLFKKLDEICSPETILASNTSSISITKIAAATKRADKVVGLHFMNPVPVMELVEVIRGIQTSQETNDTALALVDKIGKTPVSAAHDYPGFIVNRILVPMINEAFFVLMEGIAAPQEIDTAMKLGTNQPMGPLELADFVGLDTCLAICRIFHNEIGDDKYRPCPLLVKYVEAGWFGRKAGRGVYVYSDD